MLILQNVYLEKSLRRINSDISVRYDLRPETTTLFYINIYKTITLLLQDNSIIMIICLTSITLLMILDISLLLIESHWTEAHLFSIISLLELSVPVYMGIRNGEILRHVVSIVIFNYFELNLLL